MVHRKENRYNRLVQPLPSNDSLRCFVSAARELNFRRAAVEVGLTPAALGQRIRQLEELIGVALFVRTTRRVSLTEEGAALLGQAQKTLEAASECFAAARGEVGPSKMDLTIGTRHELGLSWVIPALPGIRRQRQSMTVHLYFGSGTDLLFRVNRGEIDCAITSTSQADPRLDAERIAEERYCLVGKPSLLARTPLSREEHAANHTLIDVSPRLELYRYFREGSGSVPALRFGSTVAMGTVAAIRALVLAGDGVAVLPEYFVARDLERERLTKLFPKAKPQSDYFRLIFRVGDPRRGLFARLAKFLADQPLR